MALLVGTHVNRIDKKGRVSVPKTFRDAFSEEDATLFVFPSFKYPAIEACGADVMRRYSASLEDLDAFSDKQDDLAAVILESATQLNFDPEGRVVLPKKLLDHAGIVDEVAFVGRGGRFLIWNPEEHEKYSAATFARVKADRPTLQLRREVGE